MITVGSSTPTDFRLGSSPVEVIYLGSTIVWQRNSAPVASNVSGLGYLFKGEEITIQYTYSDIDGDLEA